MRRTDPAGKAHKDAAYVFGHETGERIGSVKRAWQTAVLKAHGHTPAYDADGQLTPACRATYQAIDLHFHDLRREAASRWLDAGIPLHTIQRWLGHANLSQTSRYLNVTDTGSHDAMARFDAARGLQPIATEGGTRGHSGPSTASTTDEKPQETANGVH